MTPTSRRDSKASASPVKLVPSAFLNALTPSSLRKDANLFAYETVKAQVQGAFGRPHIATALFAPRVCSGYEHRL